MSLSVMQQPLRKDPSIAASGTRRKQSAARNPPLAAKKKQIGLSQISQMTKTIRKAMWRERDKEREWGAFIVLASWLLLYVQYCMEIHVFESISSNEDVSNEVFQRVLQVCQRKKPKIVFILLKVLFYALIVSRISLFSLQTMSKGQMSRRID